MRLRRALLGLAVLAIACTPAATPTPLPPPTRPAAAPTNTVAPTAAPATATAATRPTPADPTQATPKPGGPVATRPAAAAATGPAEPTRPAAAAAATKPAAGTPAAGTPAAAAKPAGPTPTPGPAPKEDRVGYPENYQSAFKPFYTYERLDNKQVRQIYANDRAADVKPGEAYPYGSILVMETWRTRQDAQGNPEKDAQGRWVKDALAGVFVMRKEPGFGVEYQHLRTGEWEYVAFRPDKTVQTAPSGTHTCALCHQGAGEKPNDWVFRTNLVTQPDRYGRAPTVGATDVLTSSMLFFPNAIKVKPGTRVTWTNGDNTPHTVTANDKAFDSKNLEPGKSFGHTFERAGKFEYLCDIHPQMKATVEVAS
jgi:plastocyanin